MIRIRLRNSGLLITGLVANNTILIMISPLLLLNIAIFTMYRGLTILVIPNDTVLIVAYYS
jgi:hypothetical protein